LEGVSFHDQDGSYKEDLGLNWKRLRNMVQPVLDEQLAILAIGAGNTAVGQWYHPFQQTVIRRNGEGRAEGFAAM
jgi:hypothetical protein